MVLVAFVEAICLNKYFDIFSFFFLVYRNYLEIEQPSKWRSPEEKHQDVFDLKSLS